MKAAMVSHQGHSPKQDSGQQGQAAEGPVGERESDGSWEKYL